MGDITPRAERLGAAMRRAMALAGAAIAVGEVPVAAIVLSATGEVLSEAANRVETDRDAAAHAEMLALRDAARRVGPRLPGCTLVVTLEPCAMCAAACTHFRIARLVFGAYDPKGGGVEHGAQVFRTPGCLHRPEVIGGLEEQASARLLRRFFAARRP